LSGFFSLRLDLFKLFFHICSGRGLLRLLLSSSNLAFCFLLRCNGLGCLNLYFFLLLNNLTCLLFLLFGNGSSLLGTLFSNL
jgi:hypothetical protein